jgi:NADH-quinone oxidoreductase subunit M
VMGELLKEALKSITDMTRREKAIFAPLVVMTIFLGVYPAAVTDIIGPSVTALVTDYRAAIPSSADTQLALTEGSAP